MQDDVVSTSSRQGPTYVRTLVWLLHAASPFGSSQIGGPFSAAHLGRVSKIVTELTARTRLRRATSLDRFAPVIATD